MVGVDWYYTVQEQSTKKEDSTDRKEESCTPLHNSLSSYLLNLSGYLLACASGPIHGGIVCPEFPK